MKFRKEDDKNALLTEQNEREVLFCTVTSRLLHDDEEKKKKKKKKKKRRVRGFITSWKIGGRETVFRRNIFIQTDDLLILFYISIRYD